MCLLAYSPEYGLLAFALLAFLLGVQIPLEVVVLLGGSVMDELFRDLLHELPLAALKATSLFQKVAGISQRTSSLLLQSW